MRALTFRFLIFCAAATGAAAQTAADMAGLALTSDAVSRSISAENFTGEKGKAGMAVDGAARRAARDLGQGWKVSPYFVVKPGETRTLASIAGPGTIKHIWMCPLGDWTKSRLRIYWDGDPRPAIDAPVGNFFCQGWGKPASMTSLAVCANPRDALNCYWDMPFRQSARITFENDSPVNESVYYQVDYELAPVAVRAGYLHAQYRAARPVATGSVYTILDGVRGEGQYVGTYLTWQPNSGGWWGEGEIKFYLDGDRDFPSICGTGTEDYFCGSSDFIDRATGKYVPFCSPYSGLVQANKPAPEEGGYGRFGLYRWHIRDPIRFKHDLRVTIQDLGWQPGALYRQRRDDITSVAFWYQLGDGR